MKKRKRQVIGSRCAFYPWARHDDNLVHSVGCVAPLTVSIFGIVCENAVAIALLFSELQLHIFGSIFYIFRTSSYYVSICRNRWLAGWLVGWMEVNGRWRALYRQQFV